MIRLFADSTSDMEPELIKENNITIIPLYVIMGEEQYKDGVDIQAEDIYEWSETNDSTPKSAAFSPQEVLPYIEDAKKAGDDIIYVGISSQISGCCNFFRLAAEQAEYEDHVFVVDSKSLCTAQGLIIRKAVRLMKEGFSAREIAAELTEMTKHLRIVFLLDTLVYLHRGGRCSGVAALLGGRLKIKPALTLKEGNVVVHKKYRGGRADVNMKMLEDIKEELLNSDPEEMYFIRSRGFDKDIEENILETLNNLSYFNNIRKSVAGSVISAHSGPLASGFAYVLKY